MKRPTLSGIDPVVRPQPACGARMDPNHAVVVCDLPRDHVPRDEHAQTLRWRSEPARAQPGERPLR